MNESEPLIFDLFTTLLSKKIHYSKNKREKRKKRIIGKNIYILIKINIAQLTVQISG